MLLLFAARLQEAVRALKRRVSELEGQLAAAQAAADAAARQARDAASGDAAKAAQAAAALQQAEQQLGAVREQCKEHARRRAEVDAQLATAEYERSQWEYRAKVRGVGPGGGRFSYALQAAVHAVCLRAC